MQVNARVDAMVEMEDEEFPEALATCCGAVVQGLRWSVALVPQYRGGPLLESVDFVGEAVRHRRKHEDHR